eukprot:SAG31_NODE_38411_length_296_cov_0.994924_1_plen_45_part_10
MLSLMVAATIAPPAARRRPTLDDAFALIEEQGRQIEELKAQLRVL